MIMHGELGAPEDVEGEGCDTRLPGGTILTRKNQQTSAFHRSNTFMRVQTVPNREV